MSRAQLTSTVEQNTGGAVAPFVAGKNKIINGDFGIWQRGTSFSYSSGSAAYLADRWTFDNGGSNASMTYSQQTFTPGTAPVAGYESAYFMRMAQSTNGTGQAYFNIFTQRIEDVRTLSGQTITISAWIKSDSTRSVNFQYAQIFGTGGSGTVVSSGSSITTTSGWVRYSQTFSLPSLSGKTIGTGSYLQFSVTAGAINTAQTIDIWGVQVEAGSVATPFTTASNTFQGELALCQRYYQRWTATTANAVVANGCYYSSIFHAIYPFKVTMRNAPSMNASSYSAWAINAGTTYYNPTSSIGFGIITADTGEFYISTSSSPSGGTAGYLYAGLNSYVEMSAEL